MTWAVLLAELGSELTGLGVGARAPFSALSAESSATLGFNQWTAVVGWSWDGDLPFDSGGAEGRSTRTVRKGAGGVIHRRKTFWEASQPHLAFFSRVMSHTHLSVLDAHHLGLRRRRSDDEEGAEPERGREGLLNDRT